MISRSRPSWRFLLATLLGLVIPLACNTMEPPDPDRDDDGLTNSEEALLGTNPDRADTDGDTIPDGEEIAQGTSPLAADSDGDFLRDDIDPFPLDPNNGMEIDPEDTLP